MEVAVYVEEVLQTLNDLIEYFKQPDSELEHEEKQTLLRSIIKRQDLFKEEVSERSVSGESRVKVVQCHHGYSTVSYNYYHLLLLATDDGTQQNSASVWYACF